MSSVRRSAAVLSLLFLAANAVAFAWRPAPAAQAASADALSVPNSVGGFTSRGDVPMPDDVKKALASATMVARSYEGPGSAVPVDFILIGGTDRSALHDPRSCLVGDGWRITDDRSETLPGAAGVPVRSCRIVKGEEGGGEAAYEMLYLYVVDGKVVERVTEIRGRMLAAALLGRKGAPTYFLRFVRPADAAPQTGTAEPPAKDGDRELRRFAAAMWAELGPRLAAAR